MADDPKDVIYIDVDDEITAVIDKLQSSPKKIVALVLPKRASVFQSIVNMKLLKRMADEAKKHVVLITSESAILPLAGAVGIHTAKTPQSKPEIPPAPMAAAAAANAPEGDEDPELDKSASVAALSGVSDDDDVIQVDNSDPDASGAASDAKKPKKGKKGKDAKDKKKFKIPNFDSFRKKLFLGIAALLLLIIGFVMAFVVLPRATVTLSTNTDNIDTNLKVIADPAATELDLETGVTPAISKDFRKTDTEKVAATGQKNLGKKASGEVTLRMANCDVDEVTIPAGTTVTANNLAFVTQDSATLQSVTAGGSCNNGLAPALSSETVDVIAAEAGGKYNIDSGKSFTVAGFSSVEGENDDSISGGTDKIVKVVTQDDVNKAKDAITKRAGSEAPDDLKEDIRKEGYYPIEETLNASTPTVTSQPAVGAEAEDVTVTSTTEFTMLGVKEDDLKKLIEEAAREEVEKNGQGIRDNGLDEAHITVESKDPSGRTTLAVQTIVVAGPDIDESALKEEIAGKKRGEIQEMLKRRPGINDVVVDYSPFWVTSTPSNADKITIVIEGNQDGDDSRP